MISIVSIYGLLGVLYQRVKLDESGIYTHGKMEKVLQNVGLVVMNGS